MEIKYFVRTMEGREYDLPDYIEPIIDYKHQYVMSYIEALRKINDYNAVLLEDDVVLCNNFKEECEKVINEHPDTIINFFSSPMKYYTTHFTNIFIYNQCTYFPKNLGNYLADKIMELYIDEHQRYGSLLNAVLATNNIPHLVYRPCLVQHIDAKSTRDAWCGDRNTPYFKDYLDKIGITMEEAYKKENLDRLMELLEQDRKKWYDPIRKEGVWRGRTI